jgi:hypothetical protein
MTPQEMLLKHKLSLLQLAEQLQNIRTACKMMGVSRQRYYDIKQRFEQAGVSGLHDKTRQLPRMPNQTPIGVEERIVEYSLKHPTYGKDRLPLQLRFEGIITSASTVERVWKRYHLENRFKRLLKLEELHRKQGMVLSDEQIQALLEHIGKAPIEHVFSRYPGYLLC